LRYTHKRFRNSYPALERLPDLSAIELFHRKAGIYLPKPDPWWTIASMSAFGFGVPLFFLVIASVIYRELAGFARKPQGDQ
jgi:hypothetical protein